VDIYSTFLQRSYDQIFQEVALQNLPVTFLTDRAGVVGPDGPTHHGVFDLAYLRMFPNLVVMAPGDAADLLAMLDWALGQDRPAAIRYPKAAAPRVLRPPQPVELGTAEILAPGRDGAIVACGAVLEACTQAADRLRAEGLELGVINARFLKPLDSETILGAVRRLPLVVTVEEGVLAGGFGSAVLEAAADAGLHARPICRLGIPDRFVPHGTREELLWELGLDAAGIAEACRQAAAGRGLLEGDKRRAACRQAS
jgi:1-deoxy-D-xylulose-5-phosphate synthase